MHDEFLHRLRKEPSPEFAARLQAQLRRQSASLPRPRAPSRVRTLITILLLGGTAFAITAVVMRGIPPSFVSVYQHVISRVPGGHGHAPGHAPGNAKTQGGERQEVGAAWSSPGGAGLRHNVPHAAAPTPGALSAATAAAASTSRAPSVGGALPGTLGARFTAVGSWAAYPYLAGLAGPAVNLGGIVVHIDVSVRDSDLWPPDPMCAGAAGAPEIAYSFEPAGTVGSRPCFRDASGKSSPVVAFAIAYEALALARSPLYGTLDLTRREVFLALAKWVPDPARPGSVRENSNATWRQVDSALGQEAIQFLGPPLSSPAGHSMIELLMEGGCNTYPSIARLRATDPKRYARICRTVRTDGVYTEVSYLDPSRLLAEPNAVGILPFPLTDAPLKELSVSSLDGVQPGVRSVESGTYPGSRELYLYINRQRVPFFVVRQLIQPPIYTDDKAIVAPSPPDIREIMSTMSAP